MDIVPGRICADRPERQAWESHRPPQRPGSKEHAWRTRPRHTDIVSIIDAPPTPVAALGPGRKYAVLVHYEMHPPVTTLARPYLALAGVRVDPAIAGRQRTRRLTGLSVLVAAPTARSARSTCRTASR